jgi:hypothetical protein
MVWAASDVLVQMAILDRPVYLDPGTSPAGVVVSLSLAPPCARNLHLNKY